MSIKYETVKLGCVTKKQAIAIADSRMKDTIFEEGLKDDICYGLIRFEKFEIALVQIDLSFAWHVKVKYGEWGAYEKKKFLFIPLYGMNVDGWFDEKSNISCFIMCKNGEYYDGDEIDSKMLKEPDMEQYNKMLEYEARINLRVGKHPVKTGNDDTDIEW